MEISSVLNTKPSLPQLCTADRLNRSLEQYCDGDDEAPMNSYREHFAGFPCEYGTAFGSQCGS